MRRYVGKFWVRVAVSLCVTASCTWFLLGTLGWIRPVAIRNAWFTETTQDDEFVAPFAFASTESSSPTSSPISKPHLLNQLGTSTSSPTPSSTFFSGKQVVGRNYTYAVPTKASSFRRPVLLAASQSTVDNGTFHRCNGPCYRGHYPDLAKAYVAKRLKNRVLWKPTSSAELGIGGKTGFATHINGGRVYYVDGNKKYFVQSCMPCGPSIAFCKDDRWPRSAYVQPALMKDGGNFQCRMTPQYFQGYLLWHRVPLLLELDAAQPVRVNVLMIALGWDLTGGSLSIIRFLDQILKRTRLSVRWINVDGFGIGGEQLRQYLQKYPSTQAFRERMSFIFDGARDIEQPKLLTNPSDMFMSTFYFTALMAHSTIQQYGGLRNRNFIYFIQDFGPIFSPHDANHLEALESYRYPHFAIYSAFFLEKWFTEKGYGQGQFIQSASFRKSVSHASEPAIKPWLIFNKSLFSEPSRTRKIIMYARQHARRNAYELTIDMLSAAVCEDFFEKEHWEIIGVGATFDYEEHLGGQCGRQMRMNVRKNIPENEYKKMISSGDVGVSLMVSPHPSLAPFDFASAGLINLTNSFATKTEQMFKSVSSNFVVAEPFLPELLDGLSIAISRSKDLAARSAGATLNLESNWEGARCYGADLMAKVLTWLEHTESLW